MRSHCSSAGLLTPPLRSLRAPPGLKLRSALMGLVMPRAQLTESLLLARFSVLGVEVRAKPPIWSWCPSPWSVVPAWSHAISAGGSARGGSGQMSPEFFSMRLLSLRITNCWSDPIMSFPVFVMSLIVSLKSFSSSLCSLSVSESASVSWSRGGMAGGLLAFSGSGSTSRGGWRSDSP